MTFMGSLALAFLAAVIMFIAFFIILPLWRMSRYKNSHTASYFYPLIGFFRSLNQDFLTYGDSFARAVEFSRTYPGKKALVTNSNTRALVLLRDTQYVKELMMKPYLYEKANASHFLNPLIGTGLVMAEGDTWKQHRKIISGTFHYEFLRQNVGLIQKTCQDFLSNLSAGECEKFAVINKMQELAGEMVGCIFFGEGLSNYTFEGKPLTLALSDLITELGLISMTSLAIIFSPKVLKLPIFPSHSKTLHKVDRFRSLCAKIIQDRKSNPQKAHDFLASLLDTQEYKDPEKNFSDEDVINEFTTFFLAGMDTTSHLISMVLYNLTQHPEYLEKLQAERDMSYNLEKPVTAETLQKMDVLHSFIKETLRFHSPSSGLFIRRALEDHQIGDLKIRKGDKVRADVRPLFFHEEHFENPGQFSPQRWLDPKLKLDPYAFTPFSAGPRNCIGQHLALIETKIIVSEFLERFRFKLEDGYKLRMIQRFSYEPYDKLYFNLSTIL